MNKNSLDEQNSILHVVLGCGSGDTAALRDVLLGIDRSSPMALIVVSSAGSPDVDELHEAVNVHGQLRIVPVEEELVISTNSVYLIDSDNNYLLQDGVFKPIQHDSVDQSQSPVDRFFQSLAMAQSTRAVGVILSGNGSDGTLGLKAISDAGGITIVQNPEGASFDTMPRAAIDTGVADVVLDADQIGARLLSYAAHLHEREDGKPRLASDEIRDSIPQIARLLEYRTGHNFQHYKPNTLIRRIQRHMTVVRANDVKEYRRLLMSDNELVQTLFRELLIGVTSFFRDADAFESLVHKTFSQLLDGRSSEDTVRIWVPGCASGQEAYTLAILMCEYLDEVSDPPQVKIFASDIDEQALARARAGSYPQGISEELSDARLTRFFRLSGRRYHVSKRLREMCLFSTHNVIADPPFSSLDLISCRNLMIYLGAHLQEKLISVFHYALKPGGHLFLGISENLLSHKDLFSPVHERHRISRRRDVNQSFQRMPEAQGNRNRPPIDVAETPNIGMLAKRIIVDEFTPQWAIVNDEFQILELSANASRYLKVGAGTFQNNIIRLAQDSLQPGLRSTLRQAREARMKVVHDRLLLRVDNDLKRMTLTVQPMPKLGTGEELLMVIFQEIGAPIIGNRITAHDEPDNLVQQSQSLIFQLEKELSTTQADLERTVQDLEAANEELKSSNEELLSINEEVQSSNEELETSKEEIESSHNKLEQANDDLENLLSSGQLATLFLDQHHRIKRFTPAIRSIYNLIPGDIGREIGFTTHNVKQMPPLPSKGSLGTSTLEDEIQTRDGRWYLRRVLPYQKAEQYTNDIVVTFSDITSIKEAERFIRSVIDNLNTFVGVCSTDGVLLQANKTALAAAGIDPVDVVDKPFRDAHWWANLPESQALLDDAIVRAAAGEDSRFDVEIMLCEGQRATIDFQIVPMRAADGTITHLIPSAIDVTHRRQNELALELAEEQSRALLHEIEEIYTNAPVGLCVLDTQLRYTRINKHLAEINGFSVQEHIGKSVRELLPDIADEAEPALQGVIDTGKPLYNIPLSGTTPAQPNVERHWVENVIPMRDYTGKVTGISIVAKEVTEQFRAENRLRAITQQAEQARRQAEQANRFKSDFLSNMSHEIRTPMTAILGYADLLQGHLKNPDNLQSVNTIKRNGQFLISLIDDILDLSKIESGKLDLEMSAVSPVEITEHSIDLMKLQASRKQLYLRVDYEGKLPEHLNTDPTRLRQILVNLIGNAIKFTETGGVTLRLAYEETPQPCILFHIVDTGIGIDPEHQSDIFDVFTQADSSIARRFGGSGLGLAISHRLAQRLNGTITLDSTRGKGSTFTLRLPIIDHGDMVLVVPQRPSLNTSNALLSPIKLPFKLLAVDDRRDILHVVQHILEEAGAQVTTATGATMAIQKVQQAIRKGEGYDAIVLDMQMPEVTGYQAASRLRDLGFTAPIIALTANAMTGERQKCLAAGCTDYLTKPIDRALLVESLSTHLQRGSADGDHSRDEVVMMEVSKSKGVKADANLPSQQDGQEKTTRLERSINKEQTILLVEDHVESADVLARLLSRSGYRVHVTYSASEATKALDTITPSVIISDIGLPDEDGYTLVTKMRKLLTLETCHFIALTGSDEFHQQKQSVFDHHLSKPVDIAELRRYLEALSL